MTKFTALAASLILASSSALPAFADGGVPLNITRSSQATQAAPLIVGTGAGGASATGAALVGGSVFGAGALGALGLGALIVAAAAGTGSGSTTTTTTTTTPTPAPN